MAKPKARPVSDEFLSRVSQSVAFRHWLNHPEQAPAPLDDRFAGLRQEIQAGASGQLGALNNPGGVASEIKDLFNRDVFGLPQNEESVSACMDRRDVVIGGTNDYRGLLDPQQSLTGWHLSTDGGRTLETEGLLPPVEIAGTQVPSGGDPIMVAGPDCTLYAASLNYDPGPDSFALPNGIGVYRTDVETLRDCDGGSDPACWPTRRAVSMANTPPPDPEAGDDLVFLDKEWMDVGHSGDAGTVMWVAYAEFTFPTDPLVEVPFTASIKAVRCNADLSSCTDPILISGDDTDVEFADVTIAEDGRTYITGSEVTGELEGEPQTFIHKLRVAQPGSTDFGRERIAAVEGEAIPFGGTLNANDFRVATYPKNAVRDVGDDNRVYVVWDACSERVIGENVCEEPVIKLVWSDDDGRNWTSEQIISKDGENYFPTIADDPKGNRLAVAYFTNRHDENFDHRQDVELVSLRPNGTVAKRKRLTRPSNEPNADPFLGGFFIGDYIEVDVVVGRVYTHFNANYRRIEALGEGIPVPQQDNFLDRRHL
ncbi:MAG: hypothetical protein ACR2MA_00555 [Egibacteraceae bacterium]